FRSGRKRRLRMFERLGAFVGGFLLAADNHSDAAFGIELDDHVGAFVGDPDVVVLVDADRMREGPGVEIVADLADESAVRKKLEELRSAGSVSGAGAIAAREDENMAFRIDGDANGFAEMGIRRELQKI